MNTQKLIIGLCFTLLNSFNLLGQGLKIKLEKLEFKIDETINLTFETNNKVDSVVKAELNQFEIISGPTTSNSTSIINGVSETHYSMSYEIKPIKPGKIKISAPVIYNNGVKVIGEEKYIEILGQELTSEELKKKEFESFINNSVKPKGTKRFIIKDDMGYIEIFGETHWEYQRDLTKKEIQLLKNMDLTNN